MRNGYREETLDSEQVSCSRSEVGNQMVYDFTFNHNIFASSAESVGEKE